MDEKVKGILAYVFSIVCGIIFLCLKDSSKNTKIHAAQAIVIFCLYIAASIVLGILTPILLAISWSMSGLIALLSFLIFAAYAALIIWGIIKVANEEDPALPIVNKIAMSIFKKTIDAEPVEATVKPEEPKE